MSRPYADAAEGVPAGTAWATLGALASALAGSAAILMLPALVLAPNRLAAGHPVPGVAALGASAYGLVAAFLLAGLLLAGFPPSHRRTQALAGSLVAACALGLLAAAAAFGARDLLAGRPPAARASLGSGVWVAGGAAFVLMREGVRRAGRPAAGALILGGLALAGGLAVRDGVFDALSLAVEYRGRSEALCAALGQHAVLAGSALALALVLAAPLGILRYRGGRAATALDALLTGVQVVPALALFGALVAALSAVLAEVPRLRDAGLGAIGPTPAIVGTALYLALPLVRSIAAGLAAPDPAVIDTARALGLTPMGRALRVRLPLGAPILLGGLRVALVQSIGLSTLGGLVGAGGLGAVVFEGMSQFAGDLILLGAIPIVLLSLAADRLLRLAAEGAARRA